MKKALSPSRAFFQQAPVFSSANPNKVDYPRDTCLHALIERQVERTPDAVAVSNQGGEITYRELNAQANQIAHFLIQKKVGAGSLVGLYTDPSPGMVAAMLGILKTGAAYVCLDPVYPPQKLKFMVEECELSFLLTTSRLEKSFPIHDQPILLLDDELSLKRQSTSNPDLTLSSEGQAFIVYTSGSSGNPKGVIHSHRNVISRFYSTWAFADTHENEVYAQTSPLSSIDLIDEIYPPLLRGYRLHMIDKATIRDPNRLVEALEAGKVTRLILVPSLLRTILSMELSIAHVLHALQVVLIGGEPLTYALVDLFYEKLPHVLLINFYGLTEGDGAFYLVPAGEKIASAPPIGRPIANAQIYILDPKLEPVPDGGNGEIYIANEGMARGYFKRPELDAQRFLPNPFDPASETRLYKTGDRGRFLPDGNIEYLGRIDRMIKIRGFAVELAGVEAAMSSHPHVRECIALTKSSPEESETVLSSSPKLVGYVVLKTSGSISSQALKSYLRDRLPDYALPSTILILDAFPLSPTGKVDVFALPEPEQVARELDENYVRPRDRVETRLIGLWERVLRTTPIGIHDDFFALGGDSLTAVDLFQQIEKEFGKHLPISALLEAPTIAQLGELIRQDSKSYSWSSLVPIQPSGRKLPLFCIHANGGVIMYHSFVEYLGPDQPIYGLQARGLNGKMEAPHNDLKQMASDYIEEIRNVQATGPYQLCALSMGGIVAFEMACQLRAAGEEVAFLGLLDAYSPGNPKRASHLEIRQLKLSRHEGTLSRDDSPQIVEYLQRYLRHRLAMIRPILSSWDFVSRLRRLPHRKRFNFVWQGVIARLERQRRRLLHRRQYDFVPKAVERVTESYVPGKYPGTLTIFRANFQPEGIIPDPYLGWEGCADRIELVDVPGTHDTIMKKPYLGELLKHVQVYLAE